VRKVFGRDPNKTVTISTFFLFSLMLKSSVVIQPWLLISSVMPQKTIQLQVKILPAYHSFGDFLMRAFIKKSAINREKGAVYFLKNISQWQV